MDGGTAIVLAILGITLVGESLNDLADPRLRTRRRAVGVTTLADVSVQGGGAVEDDVIDFDELEA